MVEEGGVEEVVDCLLFNLLPLFSLVGWGRTGRVRPFLGVLVGLGAVRQHVRGGESVYEVRRLLTRNETVGAVVVITKDLWTPGSCEGG